MTTRYLDAQDKSDVMPVVSISRQDGQPKYCHMCECYKPDRAHHCRECNACVLKMDQLKLTFFRISIFETPITSTNFFSILLAIVLGLVDALDSTIINSSFCLFCILDVMDSGYL